MSIATKEVCEANNYWEPHRVAARRKAKAFVAEWREFATCANCGRQPVDFHNPEHLTKKANRICNMVSRGEKVKTIAAELRRCIPLCRSCHMKEDGRLEALNANKPRYKGIVIAPKQCSECGRAGNTNLCGVGFVRAATTGGGSELTDERDVYL